MSTIEQSPITMQEIAERASVSLSTVSCVLNEKRNGVWIGEKTRRRVLDTAAALGYQPNDLARAVVSGKNRMLGFLGFNARFEAVARMLEGALGAADAQNYTLKVLSVRQGMLDPGTIDQCVRLRVAGIILMVPGGQDLSLLKARATRYRIPVAIVDNSRPFNWGIRIVSDDHHGVGLGAQHLAGFGHRRIAFITIGERPPMIAEREAGYLDAMKRLGLPVSDDHIAISGWETEEVMSAVRHMMRRSANPPTAIICPTDNIAMVAVRAIRSLGLNVPQDVSVVGFANLMMSELCDPPLTTVAQPFEEMGVEVVRHLLARVDRGKDLYSDDPSEELLKTTLIVRDSTGPVPSKQQAVRE